MGVLYGEFPSKASPGRLRSTRYLLHVRRKFSWSRWREYVIVYVMFATDCDSCFSLLKRTGLVYLFLPE